MIVLTVEQAANLLWKDQFSHSVLRPIRLDDGRYALPESVLTQPEHARWRSLLKQGSIEDIGTLTFESNDADDYRLDANGVELGLYAGATPGSFGYPAPALFDIPATGLYRFEARYNADLGTEDRGNRRKRVELIQQPPIDFQEDDTVWTSFTTIFTDDRDGFDLTATSIFHQWHQHDASAYVTPFLAFIVNSGVFTINTRSTTSGGANQTRYTGTTPASGEINHFVVCGTLGEFGHLTVWMNGVELYDDDIPLGYYGEGLDYMARLQYGIYMANIRTVDALYHANIELGTDDLSARIDNPLPLPAPPEGWPSTDTLYPDTGLYPASNLYLA